MTRTTTEVDRPIFIVGSCRSGTEMTRSVLGRHPRLAMQEYEQKYVWKHGFLKTVSDRVTPDDVRSQDVAYIREKFAEYQAEAGPSQRVAEKTCGNAFREAYIRHVFPDAKIVHIIRDGRAAAVSARDYWIKGGQVNYRKALDLPLGELARRGVRHFGRRIKKRLGGTVSLQPWGPCFPGIEEVMRDHTLIEVCGIQWREVVETGHREGTELGPERYYEFKYEDFCRQPCDVVHGVLDFLELQPDAGLDAWLEENIRTSRIDAWRDRISDEDLALLMKHIEPTLRTFGYL